MKNRKDSESANSFEGARPTRGARVTSGKDGASHRVQRVERELRDVVGAYLITGFKGELPGIISVTRVICSKDLRTAKIFVTVMGFDDDSKNQSAKDSAVEELQRHAFEVQREIDVRLRMRHCPRVSFIYDDGFENVLKVEGILRQISQEREKDQK